MAFNMGAFKAAEFFNKIKPTVKGRLYLINPMLGDILWTFRGFFQIKGDIQLAVYIPHMCGADKRIFYSFAKCIQLFNIIINFKINQRSLYIHIFSQN